MTMKRASISVVVVAFACVLAAPGASAAPPAESPANDGYVSVAPSMVKPGDTITVTGNCPQSTNSAKIWYSPPSSRSHDGMKDNLPIDDNGIVSAATAVASGAEPGDYRAAVWCDISTAPYSAQFTVSAAEAATGDGGVLGEDGTSWVLAGAGVLAAAAVAGAIYMQRRGFGSVA